MRYQWKLGEYEASLSLARRLENLWSPTSGLTISRRCACSSRSPTCCALGPLQRGARPGRLRPGTAAGRARRRPPAHPDDSGRPGRRPACARRLPAKRWPPDRKTYESFKEQYGEDYPRTLAAAHNLAGSLRAVGDFFAARRLDEDTYARQRGYLALIIPTPSSRAPIWPAACARRANSGSQSTCCAYRLEQVPDGAGRRHARHLATATEPCGLTAQGGRRERSDEPDAGHLRTL